MGFLFFVFFLVGVGVVRRLSTFRPYQQGCSSRTKLCCEFRPPVNTASNQTVLMIKQSVDKMSHKRRAF